MKFIPIPIKSAVLYINADNLTVYRRHLKHEVQLMLTNPRDAFGGHSRSPNMAPFHMIVIVVPISVP